MPPDTNFKDQDPKRQHSRPENPKDRGGSYDAGQDFDPTEGFDDHPDDLYTSDMVQEEDRFLYEAARAAEGDRPGNGVGDPDDDLDDDLDDDDLDDEDLDDDLNGEYLDEDEFDDELDDEEPEEEA